MIYKQINKSNMSHYIVIELPKNFIAYKSYFFQKIIVPNMIRYDVNDDILSGVLTPRFGSNGKDVIDNTYVYFFHLIKMYFKNAICEVDKFESDGIINTIYIYKNIEENFYLKNIDDIDIFGENNDVRFADMPYEILTLKLNDDTLPYYLQRLGSNKLTYVLLNIYDTNYILEQYSEYIDWNIISCQTDISQENINRYINRLNLIYLDLLHYKYNIVSASTIKQQEYAGRLKYIEDMVNIRQPIDVEKVHNALNSASNERYSYITSLLDK